MIQLESILTYSGNLDAKYFEKAGGLSKRAVRENAPSRQRKNFGLLYDVLNVKFLRKPII